MQRRFPFAFWLMAGLVAAPILALMQIALTQADDGVLAHLGRTILWLSAWETLKNLMASSFVALLAGLPPAWILSRYRLPLQGLLEVGLVLPLAVPSYLSAAIYLEIFSPFGALAGFLTLIMPAELALFFVPDMRSVAGAALVQGLGLCPYVFLLCRVSFSMESLRAAQVAGTLGARGRDVFWRVALPMARPALAGALTLVMLEVLNDFGTASLLGIRTLTVTVYETWVVRESLAGAVKLALIVLALIAFGITLERLLRQRARYAMRGAQSRVYAKAKPNQWLGGMMFLCLWPIALGAFVPMVFLLTESLRLLAQPFDFSDLFRDFVHSVSVAGASALLVTGIAFFLALRMRFFKHPHQPFLMRLVGLGYGVPGTVLALGLLVPLLALDRALLEIFKSLWGLSIGLLFMGTGLALVYACVVRFFSVGQQSIDAALQKIPQNLDRALALRGAVRGRDFVRLYYPMLRPAFISGCVLVFVDAFKELPAALLLRPLNFETLATRVYSAASRGAFEDGALHALLLVCISALALMVLRRFGKI